MTNSKKGAYIVKSQHPWQSKGDRHTFHYGDENSGEAEAKARALIKERAGGAGTAPCCTK